MVMTRTRQAAPKEAKKAAKPAGSRRKSADAFVFVESPDKGKKTKNAKGAKRKSGTTVAQETQAQDVKSKKPDTSAPPPALTAAGKTPTTKRGKRSEPSQEDDDDSDVQEIEVPTKQSGDNKHVDKVIPKTIEKVVRRSSGGVKSNEEADDKKEEKTNKEPAKRQSSRIKSIEMSNNKKNSTKKSQESTESSTARSTQKSSSSSREFVTTRRYHPTGDDVSYQESAEDILLRQITNPAILDKPRQRAPPKQLTRSPKPSEILRDFVPTTFAMSPSPGNEAGADDLGSHKRAMGKRKSRVDAMIAAEKRRLNGAAGLARIGEHQKASLPPVTSGYASLVSPARNFSQLISPSPAHKPLKPTPKSRLAAPSTVTPARLSVPERGNINNLSPLSMRTSRSLDATPAPSGSLFNLLSTPASSSSKKQTQQQQQQQRQHRTSSHSEVINTPRTLSKLAMKDILAAASPSMPPPPPRRLTRASAKQDAPPPKPSPPSPAKSESPPPAHEPLGPEEALEEAMNLMNWKKPVVAKKRKTKEEEAAEEAETTKAQSEVESAKSFFEDLDAEPADADRKSVV